MREITYTEAVLEAFREEMRRDPTVFHLCGGLGALASLIPEFGEERVRVCPISEDAYVGASIGAAGSGFRPIVSPGMMTFAFTAIDHNLSTRWRRSTTCSEARPLFPSSSVPPRAVAARQRPSTRRAPIQCS